MRLYLIIAATGLIVLIAFLTFKSAYDKSLFVRKNSRAYVGIWLGKDTYVLSISQNIGQSHMLYFPPEQEVIIPGGLKGYKVGALGKVAHIAEDTKLYKKALSQISGLPIDEYLYLDTSEVFYAGSEVEDRTIGSITGEVRGALWSLRGTSLLNKIFLYQKLGNMRGSNTELYIKLKPDPVGMYDREFRSEKKLVQMIHSNTLDTAAFLAKLLEGVGIRVSDIGSQPPTEGGGECQVIERGTEQSATARYITDYFGCKYKLGDTGLYEVQFILSKPLVAEWKL
ncbi:MAG: hypothetical protein WCJ70_00880 [bacterium]